jgi:hypothetical protein
VCGESVGGADEWMWKMFSLYLPQYTEKLKKCTNKRGGRERGGRERHTGTPHLQTSHWTSHTSPLRTIVPGTKFLALSSGWRCLGPCLSVNKEQEKLSVVPRNFRFFAGWFSQPHRKDENRGQKSL